MKNDSKKRYGNISKTFHWLMAALIGWQLFKFGDRIAEGEHWIGETIVPWHISIGSVLTILIVMRLVWAFIQRSQRPEHDPATAKLVKTGHGLLYLGMLLMPLSGIMVMLGGGYGLTAFGVEIFAKSEKIAWATTLGGIHSPLAWGLTALIIGHIGMALKHHFVNRDDTLKRML